MKVLVTGAGGRLGLALRKKLINRADLSATFLISPGSTPRAKSDIKLDLADFGGLSRIVHDVEPDAIIHLAGVNGAACDRNPTISYAINVAATEVLRKAAAASGTTRIVFTSTAAVYGDQRTRPVDESDPVELLSTYARHKYSAEEILRDSDHRNFVSSVCLRIFNLYGNGFADSLVERLLASSPATATRLQGLDSFVRDYVHSDDVTDSILLALNLAGKAHSIFNVGSGVPTTNRQLVKSMQSRQPIYYEIGESRQSYSCANIALARQYLGYTPTQFIR